MAINILKFFFNSIKYTKSSCPFATPFKKHISAYSVTKTQSANSLACLGQSRKLMHKKSLYISYDKLSANQFGTSSEQIFPSNRFKACRFGATVEETELRKSCRAPIHTKKYLNFGFIEWSYFESTGITICASMSKCQTLCFTLAAKHAEQKNESMLTSFLKIIPATDLSRLVMQPCVCDPHL